MISKSTTLCTHTIARLLNWKINFSAPLIAHLRPSECKGVNHFRNLPRKISIADIPRIAITIQLLNHLINQSFSLRSGFQSYSVSIYIFTERTLMLISSQCDIEWQNKKVLFLLLSPTNAQRTHTVPGPSNITKLIICSFARLSHISISELASTITRHCCHTK